MGQKYPKKKYAPRKRKYPVDEMMKEYLSSMANRAHFDEVCQFASRRAVQTKTPLTAGWKSRILMDLVFPSPVKFSCESPVSPNPEKSWEPVLPSTDFAKIVRLQGRACYLCGEPFTVRNHPSRDHVVPKSLGGKNEQNVLAACKPCNSLKSNRPPFACEIFYRDFVHERLERLMRTRARRKVTGYENPEFSELEPL